MMSAATKTASFTFPNLPNGTLPYGNNSASVVNSGVTDPAELDLGVFRDDILPRIGDPTLSLVDVRCPDDDGVGDVALS